MTGIERHWQELADKERAHKINRLKDLEYEVRLLQWDLYPAQMVLGQQMNAVQMPHGMFDDVYGLQGLLGSLGMKGTS